MKIISLLSAGAVIGIAVSLLTLSFSAEALGSYAAVVSVLVVLGLIRDYSPRRSYWEPARATTVRFPSAPAGEPSRLAA